VLVVDSSAAVLAFVGTGDRAAACRAMIERDQDWAVPEHWAVEVASALRGLVAGRHIAEAEALSGLARLRRADIRKVAISMLIPSIWTLRHNFSAYDAAYLSLAAENAGTLVTGDAPLSRAALGHCRVEQV
jgi:predicted nucleic acid-binding protein